MKNVAQQIAQRLLEIQAVQVKMDPPFTWTSGILSPVYCDNRRLIAYPEHRKAVVEAWKLLLYARVDSGAMEMPDVIGGTATAAIPWAAFLAYDLDLPMIYIRTKPKEHGAAKRIEGDLKSGQKVLIVEDLISTGGSSIDAVEAVRNEGKGVVTDVFAIVSWEISASVQAFEAAAVHLSNLTGFTHLISEAVAQGLITPEQQATVLEFKGDPAGWAAKMGL